MNGCHNYTWLLNLLNKDLANNFRVHSKIYEIIGEKQQRAISDKNIIDRKYKSALRKKTSENISGLKTATLSPKIRINLWIM